MDGKLTEYIFNAQYKGNIYIILNGDLEGRSFKALSLGIKGGEQVINMMDAGGVKISIPYNVFDEITALEFANPVMDEGVVSSNPNGNAVFEDANGEVFSKQVNQPPPPPPQNNQQQNQNKNNNTNSQNPISIVLNNLKNSKKEKIILEVEVDMIDEQTFILLKSAFDERAVSDEVLKHILSKISMDFIKDELHSNLKRYLKDKFNITENEDIPDGVAIGEVIK
jgi:hypothetical protein